MATASRTARKGATPSGRTRTAAAGKPSAAVPHLSVAERVARGKAARAEVPRASHALFEPPPTAR